MAYTCRLVKGSDSIDLHLNDPGWTLLDESLKLNRPQRHSIYGGPLQKQLVRQEDGKRNMRLELAVKGSTMDNLIDRVNELEAMLRDAAEYRCSGAGTEIFLELKPTSATESVLFPVLEGEIDTSALYSRCNEPNITIQPVPVYLTCEPYWESDTLYTLENLIDNPGWWRWAAAPGDSWTEVNAPDLTSTQETTIYEVMGCSLKQVYVVDAVNDTGVISDAQAVAATTDYYFEARNYRGAGCDALTAQVYDITNGAVIAASTLTFNGATGEWIKSGVSFTTPAGCISVRVEQLCLAGDSVAGGTAYWDAVYLEPRSDAPTGWCSGRNLVNHLDDDADHLNVLCVTEIPGEVEAETCCNLVSGQTLNSIRIAKRSRDEPHNFIWQLTPCGAYTTAEGGAGGACAPGLIDANCKDSDKIIDATSPSGSRVEVSFAGNQLLNLRCYWNISSNLTSYYGKFAPVLLCKASGGTDVIKIRLRTQAPLSAWRQGYVYEMTAETEPAGDWTIIDGWTIHQFPCGTHPNDNFAAGNYWSWMLYAETDGTPTDSLYVAGLYLVPLDEAYFISSDAEGEVVLSATMTGYASDLDGDRGFFMYSPVTTRYYSNSGYVGEVPLLNAREENWLYFILDYDGTVDIDETVVASLTYRPRGIFLRGSDLG